MIKRLKNTKTLYAALATILGAWAMFFSGETEITQAVTLTFESILVICLRDGIAKQ